MRSQLCRLALLSAFAFTGSTNASAGESAPVGNAKPDAAKAQSATAPKAQSATTPKTPEAAKPTAQAASPSSAAELFRAMAGIQGLETRFREQKQLALLKAPLVSEGRLYYMRAGYLARLIEKPSASGVRITPSSLEVNSGQGYQRVDLTGRPDIKLFVESFAKVLAGDYAALAALYDISFTPKTTDSNWSLMLKPKAGNLVHLVKSLELRGQGFEVRELKLLETKGDTSTTVLELVSAKRTFTADEQRTFFGIAASTNLPGEKR